jgi:hypothetical protein
MAQTQEAQSLGAKVAAIAKGELGMKACSGMTKGKPGYFTSCHSDGQSGPPELWCSDFARWVWWKAGALNTDLLTPAAGSFGSYGPVRPDNPRVGDAVLFNYNAAHHTADHVAIVIQVNANGTIVTIGGDENGQQGSDQHWASTSSVAQDGPYNGAHNSTDGPGQPLSGYVSPVEDDMPYTEPQIVKLVQQGVHAELNTKIDTSGITTAQGAEAAVQARDALTALSQQVANLTTLVTQALAALPQGGGTPSTGGAPSTGT